MTLEPEAVGLRRRLSKLRESLGRINDPFAASLVRIVIEDIEARLASLAAVADEQPQPALQQQQPQQENGGSSEAGQGG